VNRQRSIGPRRLPERAAVQKALRLMYFFSSPSDPPSPLIPLSMAYPTSPLLHIMSEGKADCMQHQIWSAATRLEASLRRDCLIVCQSVHHSFNLGCVACLPASISTYTCLQKARALCRLHPPRGHHDYCTLESARSLPITRVQTHRTCIPHAQYAPTLCSRFRRASCCVSPSPRDALATPCPKDES